MQHPVKSKQGMTFPAAAAIFLTIAAWLIAGPSQFGGPTTYLTTSGTSMQPRFHTGDLAIVRRTSGYRVGDIVAYHLTSRSLVLHRIVGQDGDRFLMKGDNNAWIDSFEPSTNQIAGKLWIHLPDIGRVLVWLRSPAALVTSGAIVLMAAFAGDGKKKRGTPRKSGSRTMDDGLAFLRRIGIEIKKEDLLTVAAAVALGSLILALVAFAHPLSRMGAGQVQYDQGGTFHYSAAAPSAVYANNQVTSGDPVFLQIVRDLDVGFDYHFNSTAGHDLHGTYSLALQISQESGWQRTAVLVPETAFSGDRVSMDGNVSLLDVQAAMAAFQTETGISNSDFRLAVVPNIRVQGSLAGAALDESYAPVLPFQLDATRLTLDKDANQPDPLHPAEIGVAPFPRTETNSFGLLGGHVSILAVRFAALTALLLSSGAVLLVLQSAQSAVLQDEPARIEARFGALLLNMQGGFADLGDGKSVVDVLSIEDLVRVAEQQNRMILHSHGGGAHRYFVADGDIVYRYTTLVRIYSGRVFPLSKVG